MLKIIDYSISLQFHKYLLSIYYVPKTILNPYISEQNSQFLDLMELKF